MFDWLTAPSMRRFCTLSAVLFLIAVQARAEVRYVKSGVAGGDGSCWARAFDDLQDALDAAVPGDEIWVAAGTYVPSVGAGRRKTFALRGGLKWYGGFAGGESVRSARDPEIRRTILSGDLGVVGDPGDDAYHVVSAIGMRADSVPRIDGFTITGGRADIANTRDGFGGGLLILGGNAEFHIVGCRFVGNFAQVGGGAFVGNLHNGRARFVNCAFEDNSTAGASGLAAGITADDAGSVELTDCVSQDASTEAGEPTGEVPTLCTVYESAAPAGGEFDSDLELKKGNQLADDGASSMLSGPPAGQCGYEVRFLAASRDDPHLTGTGMNNRGQVVGYISSLGIKRGFVWSEEEGLTVLPTAPGGDDVNPNDINDAGQIVGTMGGEFTPFRAFVWEGEQYLDLGIPAGGTYSNADAINEAGVVVGSGGNSVTGPARLALLWRDGVMTDLGPVLGTPSSRASDISNSGVIAGSMGTSHLTDFRTFVLDGNSLLVLGPIPGGFTSEARGINGVGDICGRGRVPYPGLANGTRRAFAWIDGAFAIFPPTEDDQRSSTATDINNSGQVVGYSSNPHASAFMVSQGAQTRLDALVPDGIFFAFAWAIDESGRVLANGSNDVTGGAAVLTPIIAPGDLNRDCRVDVLDLLTVLVNFGCLRGCEGDIDNDGDVDLGDLAILLASWTA